MDRQERVASAHSINRSSAECTLAYEPLDSDVSRDEHRRLASAHRSGSSGLPLASSKFGPRQLVDVVHDVTAFVNPDLPQSVRQRQFDDARARAGVPDVPSARAIFQRLGVGWAELKRIAHGPQAKRLQRLRIAQSDRGRKGISIAQVHVAMRQVAARLSKSWIDRSDYVKGRELMSGRGRRALPSLNQVEEVLEQEGLTWVRGVEGAGLEPPQTVAQSGLGAREAARAFADTLGMVPRGVTQLIEWGKAAGVSVAMQARYASALEQAISELQAERARAGLEPLPVAPRDAALVPPGRAAAGPVRRRYWNKETIIDGMAIAVRYLRAGESLSQRTLKRIARDYRDQPIPSYSTVQEHLHGESFSDWCREAERRAALSSVPAE